MEEVSSKVLKRLRDFVALAFLLHAGEPSPSSQPGSAAANAWQPSGTWSKAFAPNPIHTCGVAMSRLGSWSGSLVLPVLVYIPASYYSFQVPPLVVLHLNSGLNR